MLRVKAGRKHDDQNDLIYMEFRNHQIEEKEASRNLGSGGAV